MLKPDRSDYKQQVKAFFDRSKNSYDNYLTYSRAIKLLELTPISSGQQILDLATGTGIIALAAADAIGSEGKVIGVDISPGMLETALPKIKIAGGKNIELIEADADFISFGDRSFDIIFCSSSLVWFSNIPAALANWNSWLKEGGLISFSCYSDTSFSTAILARVCQQFDIFLPNWNETLGTPEKCRQMCLKMLVLRIFKLNKNN